MPRKLRVQYVGVIYHLMNRGDRRENIFEDEQDHVRFLETLGEACQKTGGGASSCLGLMSNHFHWVVKTPKGDKRNVMLAAELRANTAMTKEWIARRLRMGTRWYLIWRNSLAWFHFFLLVFLTVWLTQKKRCASLVSWIKTINAFIISTL